MAFAIVLPDHPLIDVWDRNSLDASGEGIYLQLPGFFYGLTIASSRQRDR